MPHIPASALLAVFALGDAAAVSRLLPTGDPRLNLSGAAFQCLDATKGTPLIMAVLLGHTHIVRLLLERAPNTAVDYVDGNGSTAGA